jgi:misacylated tRNA(Ala) deacylase
LTDLLYLFDHYLKEFDATVLEIPDPKTVVLNRTAFYPRGGGQPSDRGNLISEDGNTLAVLESTKVDGKVLHHVEYEIPEEQRVGLVGRRVRGVIDWNLRYKHMRHHTALHLLSGVVFLKFNAKITGGQIYSDRARLDLSLADLNREKQALIENEMNIVVRENKEVKTLWLDREEALKRTDLYRLIADLLPKGADKLRIVDIVGFDAQLDGGTHVAKTGEIGTIKISRTENKGKENKRIEIILV